MTQAKVYPWWEPKFDSDEAERVTAVIASGMVNDGAITREFERKIAELTGAAHAVAVGNCTTALTLSLLAHGVGHGDEVIVPALTYVATANAARMAGATVVFVDVGDDGNINPALVEAAVTAKTKAIIPVHISGRPAKMAEIMDIAARRRLVVIEDAAEALGSAYKGKALGTHGHAGCFSFSPMKTITTGQGGMIVTNDAALHDRLRELKDQGRLHGGTGGDDEHPTFGINAKLTNVHAAIGLAQLARLEERLEHQRMLARVYGEELGDIAGIVVGAFDLADGAVPQWADVQLRRRDDLCDVLEAASMHCRKFWFPVPSQKPYGGDDSAFPVARRVSAESLWLPSALTLSEEDIRAVCGAIKEWAKG